MNEHQPAQELSQETFYDAVRKLQQESDDARFQAVDVTTLGEQERVAYEKERQGTLADEELLALQDAAIPGTSQKTFYDFLVRQRFLK